MRLRTTGFAIGFVLGILTLTSSVTLRSESIGLELPKPLYTSITPGLDYANPCETNRPWSIHIARLDWKRKDFAIVTTLAKNRIQGLESLSRQMAAFPPGHGHPLAAINGDFFHIKAGPYQGELQGLQILDGELVNAPENKCLWIGADGTPHIDVIFSIAEITWPTGAKLPFHLNGMPPAHAATLFTSTFGRTTEATNAAELVLQKAGDTPWLPLHVGETYRARVMEIHPIGNTAIPSNAMVLAVTGEAKTNLATIKPGDILQFTTATKPAISNVTYAIGGGPILVSGGVIQDWPVNKGIRDHIQPRHPRTALGYNDRYFFLVVVDGRQPELSIGMTWPEFSALMKQIGCTDALNLDGGGSATFWLNGKVVNSPSDKRERSIANAVAIVRKP